MDDTMCPRCKTTKYRNPALKLYVNTCGHGLCETCVDLLFVKGYAACPQCDVTLRKSNFRTQMFEDSGIEKEMRVRRNVLNYYNKKEEDFASAREYNNYLEEVEDIVYKLTQNIDLENTYRRIEDYKRENREQILRNKTKRNKELFELDQLLENEKETEKEHLELKSNVDTTVKRRKFLKKEALIDELMYSESNAKEIVTLFSKERPVNANEDRKSGARNGEGTSGGYFSSGLRIGGIASNWDGYSFEDNALYEYVEPNCDLEGPECPTRKDSFEQLYVYSMPDYRAVAGYLARDFCARMLECAVEGLYTKPTRKARGRSTSKK